MSENFEEMQFTPANGQQRITVVKGEKPNKQVIEKSINVIVDKMCQLTFRSQIIGIELGQLKEDLETISYFISNDTFVSENDAIVECNKTLHELENDLENDDVSECSNTLSDFENDSESDSADESDNGSDDELVISRRGKSCEAVHKIYNINLNFN